MIVYEPPGDLQLPRGSRIRKRDLAAFVRAAGAQIPLRGEVSVLLAGDGAVRALNRQYRKKNKPTDVLSFPAPEAVGDNGVLLAGDLAISLETALRQAEEAGHSLQTELKILLLHGLLHLAGYDHETDSGAMRRREERLRKQFDLPAGLIARTGAAPGPRRMPVRRSPQTATNRTTAAELTAGLPKRARRATSKGQGQ